MIQDTINIPQEENNHTPSSQKVTNIVSYYKKKAYNTPMLNRENELELIKLAKKGCKESSEKIINAYLRTIISLSEKHCENNNLDLSDAIQEGISGVQSAIKEFDLSKYTKLGSMFSYFAYRAILMKLEVFYRTNIRSFCVTSAVNTKLYNINKLYKQGLLNVPTYEEMRNVICSNLNLNKLDADELLTLFKPGVELDKPINDDTEQDYKDIIIESFEKKTPSSILMNEELMGNLTKAINSLPLAEQKIIKLKYGIDCKKCSTSEIGEKTRTNPAVIYSKLNKIYGKLKKNIEHLNK